MGNKAPLVPRCDGTKFAKWQNFFFYRNKDLYLLFDSRLSLIFCCCFFAFKLFFGIFVKCFWQFAMPNFIVGVITNLQSLNPVHNSQPIVCWFSGWYFHAEWIHGSQGLREKHFQEARRSILDPQILLGPPSIIGAHAVKSFFVGRV